MKSGLTQSLLGAEMEKLVTKKHIPGAVMRVESGDSAISLSGHDGIMDEDNYYFIEVENRREIAA